jgi:diguanylate cyclase (GGDEF)-like protein
VAAVPLAVGERCLGVVLIQSRAARVTSPAALATAALMGRLTALVLSTREGTAAAASKRPASSPTGEPPATKASARILIVEDDAELATIMAETLAEEGYLVEQARSGEEGLRRATAAPPGLVLLDVNLPRVDGFDTAERLRQAPATRDVPILFLSGTGDLATRVRTARLEEVDFLAKPYAADELLTRVHRALAQAAARRRLRAEAEHDALTGLGNLRLLRTRMAAERARFERYGMPLALVVVDVDKLKHINDEHGHRAGDRALRGVADVLRREVRETDLAVRTGGDEFVVLLPHTTLAEGMAFAHRTSAAIAELEPGGVHVTVSIGVASLAARGSGESDDDLLHRADSAAYRAKRRGGNQVACDEGVELVLASAIDDAPRAD